MPAAKAIYHYLERRPDSLYKQMFVKGTRIRARILYGHYMNAEEPRSPEEIAADFNLPLAAVQEDIAYCDSDPPEIEQDHRREEALIEATGMNKADYTGHPRLLSAEERSRIYNDESLPRRRSQRRQARKAPATSRPRRAIAH
jgi:uncharacterized protein (DUF433 family)